MTETVEDLEAELRAFIAAPKFKCREPEFQFLNPSPPGVTAPLELALNGCAEQLIELLHQGAPKSFAKTAIKASLWRLDKPSDTEDREYVCFYYDRLAKLAGINMSYALNVWLYGWPLGALLSLRVRA